MQAASTGAGLTITAGRREEHAFWGWRVEKARKKHYIRYKPNEESQAVPLNLASKEDREGVVSNSALRIVLFPFCDRKEYIVL